MLVVLPMSDLDALSGRADDPGVVFLPTPPVLDGKIPLEQQVVAAAVAGGIDEPTELADFAIEVLDAESLLPREPWPFSRGEQQIGGLLIVLGQPFRELVLVDPTAGLDARRRRALVGFLTDLAEDGARITVVSDEPAFTNCSRDQPIHIDRLDTGDSLPARSHGRDRSILLLVTDGPATQCIDRAAADQRHRLTGEPERCCSLPFCPGEDRARLPGVGGQLEPESSHLGAPIARR